VRVETRDRRATAREHSRTFHEHPVQHASERARRRSRTTRGGDDGDEDQHDEADFHGTPRQKPVSLGADDDGDDDDDLDHEFEHETSLRSVWNVV
jgi:hypothetical protein